MNLKRTAINTIRKRNALKNEIIEKKAPNSKKGKKDALPGTSKPKKGKKAPVLPLAPANEATK